MTIKRRPTYTPEFRLEAAQLVVHQNYSVREAASTMNIGKSTMDKWVRQLRKELNRTVTHPTALTPDQRKIKELEKRIKRIELEKEILKKATVYSNDKRNSCTKILICRRAFDEPHKAHIYPRENRGQTPIKLLPF